MAVAESIQRSSSHERLSLLDRRLREAQAIMGCGDAPDIAAAADECERLEREIADLDAARESGGESRC